MKLTTHDLKYYFKQHTLEIINENQLNHKTHFQIFIVKDSQL